MLTTTEHTFTAGCLFGGGGGMARGSQLATQRFREHVGRFELAGAYDFDAYACSVYGYLTGCEEQQLDARTLTPGDVFRLFGGVSPNKVALSAPCKGASKLLSSEKAATEKYQSMNDLSYRGVLTLLDAFPGDEPDFLLFENVPNITTRAARMLADLRKLLRSRGYVLHDGFHEARHIGNLAQRRKRWFMVARNPRKVPVFLYKPPHQPGKVCGDVLGPLPLPNDPAGGPMHQLSDTSMINLLRLWAIPAGGDWRDLLPDDGTPRRARFRRHHIEKWTEPSVTIGGSGSNGPCGVADPRAEQTTLDWKGTDVPVTASPSNGAPGPQLDLARARPSFDSTDHVLPWDGVAKTVTGATRPGNGAPSVCDPRVSPLVEGNEVWHDDVLGVVRPEDTIGTVTGRAGPTTGSFSYADPRGLDLLGAERGWHDGALGVAAEQDVAATVTGAPRPGNGRFSYAAPVPPELRPQAGNPSLHWGKYVVVGWGGSSQTVTGAARVGSGAQSVADPRVPLATGDSAWHHGAAPGRYGVLSPLDTANTVTGNARATTGPFSYAAPAPVDLVPTEKCYDAGYGVLSPDQPARTIAANTAVGCGAYAIADEVPTPVDLALGCAPHVGAYGVTEFGREAATVTAHFKIDNSPAAVADPRPPPPPYVVLSYEETKRIVDGEVAVPFAIVDPGRPEEALAIVDDMKRPPFRWVETRSARGKVTRKKETVALVLISADGTWHRPLTTLELAVLQGLPWQLRGLPLDFGGGTTAQREAIGNMVPPPVAQAMDEQVLLSLIISRTVGFALGDPGTPVWVQGVRRLERALAREGYVVVKGRRPMNFATGEMLDDGAMRWKASSKRKKAKRARATVGRRSAPMSSYTPVHAGAA